jgi:hypothetical protein
LKQFVEEQRSSRMEPSLIGELPPVAIDATNPYMGLVTNYGGMIMKTWKILPAALGLLLATQLVSAAAQEVQTYRPAPRGLDVVPIKPLILRNGSPANPASRDCTGSSRCYDFRVNRPVGPSGPTQTERCRAQYQSYRAFDNTYQPFNGPRRTCDL